MSDESSNRSARQGTVYTDGTPPDVQHVPSPEDLAGMFMPHPVAPPSGRSLRVKLLGALLFAGIGVGASVMSCVGQSFSLRQARALEGIEQQLQRINTSCPSVVEPRR